MNIRKVIEVGKGYNIVQLVDLSFIKRVGTRAWRNCNPGNLEEGEFSRIHGSIGADPRFAIFPSYEIGRRAKEILLFESKGYKGKTLSQALLRYAPPNENDTSMYINTVLKVIKIDKLVSTYSDADRRTILNVMEQVEGFRAGNIILLDSADYS